MSAPFAYLFCVKSAAEFCLESQPRRMGFKREKSATEAQLCLPESTFEETYVHEGISYTRATWGVTPLCSVIMLPLILVQPHIVWKSGWESKLEKLSYLAFPVWTSPTPVRGITASSQRLKSSLFPVIWTLQERVTLWCLLRDLQPLVQKWYFLQSSVVF